jgi:hypothetical protein
LESLEAAIAELDNKKSELAEAVNTAGGDYEQLQTLVEQIQAVEIELETAMLRWLDLSE